MDTKKYDILKIGAVPAQAFTAAVTNIITSAAHGLSNGDKLRFTTSTTLPAGLSLLTDYFVRDATTDTFKVSATPGGTEVDITDTGTGTHTYKLMGRVIFCADADTVNLSIVTNNATLTYKVQGSDTEDGDDVDFGAAIGNANIWDYVEAKDLENENAVQGDDGVALTTTSEVRQLEVNVSKLRWITVDVYSYTSGSIGITASLYKNN